MWSDKAKVFLAGGSALIALTACQAPGQTTPMGSSVPVTTTDNANAASGYGVIQSIDIIQSSGVQGPGGIGLGTVAGAVVGGVLGNQVGSGTGRTAATVAGAAGGAYAGNRMERNSRAADEAYRITVRMENGTTQTLTQKTQPNLQTGERVRLVNGAIVERFR